MMRLGLVFLALLAMPETQAQAAAMAGASMHLEGVKGTYGKKVMIGVDRWF